MDLSRARRADFPNDFRVPCACQQRRAGERRRRHAAFRLNTQTCRSVRRHHVRHAVDWQVAESKRIGNAAIRLSSKQPHHVPVAEQIHEFIQRQLAVCHIHQLRLGRLRPCTSRYPLRNFPRTLAIARNALQFMPVHARRFSPAGNLPIASVLKHAAVQPARRTFFGKLLQDAVLAQHIPLIHIDRIADVFANSEAVFAFFQHIRRFLNHFLAKRGCGGTPM